MSDVGRHHLATGSDKIQRVHPTPKTPAFVLFKVEFLQFKIKSVSQGYYWLSDSDPLFVGARESGSYVLFQNHQPRPTKPLSLFEIMWPLRWLSTRPSPLCRKAEQGVVPHVGDVWDGSPYISCLLSQLTSCIYCTSFCVFVVNCHLCACDQWTSNLVCLRWSHTGCVGHQWEEALVMMKEAWQTFFRCIYHKQLGTWAAHGNWACFFFCRNQ